MQRLRSMKDNRVLEDRFFSAGSREHTYLIEPMSILWCEGLEVNL